MEVLNEDEIEKQFALFEMTFPSKDSEKAKQLFQYIARQMNSRTLRGYVEHEFDQIVRNSAKGIFYITYLQQMNYPEDIDILSDEERVKYSADREIILAKTICKSAFNMFYLLATRVHKGRDYELLGREIDSRKPLLISQK